MKWSQERRTVFSRGVIALVQGIVVLGFGGCDLLQQDNPSGGALGTACTHHTDCTLGSCEDGVCCDSLCFQTCMACNVAGHVGTCAPVPKFAEDPVASDSFECTSPAQCDGAGTCRANIGQTCGWQVECWSGFCEDGVCCESACDQTCMTCNDSGTCVPTPALLDDFKCAEPVARCDGNGGCIRELGQVCTDATGCVSGFCADGVCCDVACTDACKGCAVAGSVGTCSSVPAYESDTSAAIPCDGPVLTCNGAGVCKSRIGVACSTDAQCASGSCSNGTCQPPGSQTGPIQWQWSNDQSVCKDPNGHLTYKDTYPVVKLRQIVARDDESIFGVGNYLLPSMGLASGYGFYLGNGGDVVVEGPHTFKLDVASFGASASWSTVDFYNMSITPYKACESGPWDGTELVGPFIEPVGGDIVFYRQNLDVHICKGMTTSTCEFGELSKHAAPQWSLGTTEVCAHDALGFAGDAAGNVVTREDDRLKKYDPTGAVVLDVPTPFDFGPTTLGLSAMGDIHAVVHSSKEVRLARTDPSGTLAWTKTFPNPIPMGLPGAIDLAVDVFGNSIVAFYAYKTMDLGNGPLQLIGAKDLVLAKFDMQGNVVWAKRVGSGGFAPITFSMRKTGADDIALMVHFTGTVDLGDGVLESSPVLIKYDASGNLVWRADLLPLYPPSAPEVLSVAIAGHPSGAVFVAGTGYGLASSTPEPHCDLGVAPNGVVYNPGTYPRPLRMFAAKYGP